ncbi:two-component response regulator [Saccharopolyspora erythraea NRRL 2338]|uniref:Two-component response regulator n=2 Tax=Saccharopolyspora erythraea TaxID=1836 RepID=A4FDK0_SACEN|nr:diguanylate phosphodiesterase [Saccharopolyspora erythraea D]QRK93546.1 EAL domain-containing protein [Saccharopolyspora erythraea]CAM02125.1 two-component response regulator [Saccharopolyspora erythraea NRRL 2338]
MLSHTGMLSHADKLAWLVEAERMARMGSFAFDVARGVGYGSPLLMEWFAQGQDEIVVDDLHQLLNALHPDDRAAAEKCYTEVVADPGGLTRSVQIRDQSGEHIYLCNVRAEHGPDGRLARLLGTVQDVTEQRTLEWKLRDEQQRVVDAQQLARLGTWEWDPGSGRTRFSDLLYELTGRNRAETTTYHGYLERVPADERRRVHRIWQGLRRDRQPVEFEHRYVRLDGSVRVWRMHGAERHDIAGRPRLLGTVQDVTEEHAAQSRLRRFIDLCELAPVGVGLFDQEERLVHANPALCRLLGHSPEQLRGMTTEAISEPGEQNRWSLPDAARGSGTAPAPRRWLRRRDGDSVYCELHSTESVQDDGTRFWLVVFQDVTEPFRTAEILRHQATHDELTGLPNHTAVKAALGDLLASAGADRVAVFLCDIDNFKRINNSLGHDAGDELLVALARRLESRLPRECTPARLSGDDFLVVCSDIDAAGGVESLARTMSGLLSTAVPVHGQLIKVSVSIGAAMRHDPLTTGGDLLRFADAALSEAKRQGSGRLSLAGPALRDAANQQVHLEGELRKALQDGELEMHYQPVVSDDGTIVTVESLLRWPHPERGMLRPGAFMPIAEQGGMLRDLDLWVLRTCLREAADWPLARGAPVRIAVNLSALVPGDPGFVDTVREAITDSGIAPSRVILELVETALVDLPDRSRQAMDELTRYGVRFSVDDFGTGYSSLARLKDLPAHTIKLDRRFVSGVVTDPADLAVAKAVADIAHAMRRRCVAEGVETATQFHVLRGIGVNGYQGWLFSYPLPARELLPLLRKGHLPVPTA